MIQEKVVNAGIQHAVIMTGKVEHKRVTGLLVTADVAVAPFAPFSPGKGGSPLKLFEYMAAGKAIIATRTGHVAQVIQDGENGLLVEPGDVIAFTNAIVMLLTDTIKRKRIGQSARRKAIEQYSWEHYAKRLEEIYESVLRQTNQAL